MIEQKRQVSVFDTFEYHPFNPTFLCVRTASGKNVSSVLARNTQLQEAIYMAEVDIEAHSENKKFKIPSDPFRRQFLPKRPRIFVNMYQQFETVIYVNEWSSVTIIDWSNQRLKNCVNLNYILGLREGDLVDTVEYISEANILAIMTERRKYVYFLYLFSKYSEPYSEKKMLKKISLPSKSENRKMFYVSHWNFIFFYGNSSQINIFDLKKESFIKNTITKGMENRKAIITSLSVSQCQNFMICTDEIGDLQLWSISSKGLEAIYANNISKKPLISCQFLMNSYTNDITSAVCLGLDNILYMISFERLAKNNYRVSLDNKIYLGKTEDINFAEYEYLNLDGQNDLKASFATKWVHVSSLEIVRTKDNTLISTRKPLLYKLVEDNPLEDLVFFERFTLNGTMARFKHEKSTFEVSSELYFATVQGVIVYNMASLQMKQALSFDSLFKDDSTKVTKVKKVHVIKRTKRVDFMCILKTNTSSTYFLLASFDKAYKPVEIIMQEKIREYGVDNEGLNLTLVDDSLRAVSFYSLKNTENDAVVGGITKIHTVVFGENINRIKVHEGYLIVFSRVREHVFKVHPTELPESGEYNPTPETMQVNLGRGEIVREIKVNSAVSESPIIHPWTYLLVTNIRLLFLGESMEILASSPQDLDITHLRFAGFFEENLIFQDRRFVYYFDPRVHNPSLQKILSLDSSNEKLVSMLPDRLLVAKTTLDDKDKYIKVEINQRHCFNSELLLSSIVCGSNEVSVEALENLISIFWESDFSEDFLQRWAKVANDKTSLEIIKKYGGIDALYQQKARAVARMSPETKEFLQYYLKEYLMKTNSGSIEVNYLANNSKTYFMSELVQHNFQKKVEDAKALGLLPADIELGKIKEYLSRYDTIRKPKKLHKQEVAFGQDAYR